MSDTSRDAQHERVTGALGDPQIEIALAKPGVLLGDAVELVGERSLGRREQRPRVDPYRQLPSTGLHDLAGHADPVADRQAAEAVEVRGRLRHGEQLDPGAAVVEGAEGELALGPSQHEATGDRHGHTRLGAVVDASMSRLHLGRSGVDVVAIRLVGCHWFLPWMTRRPCRVSQGSTCSITSVCGRDQPGQAAGGDDRAGTHLGLEAPNETVDLSGEAIQRTGLQRLGGGLAHRVTRRDHLDGSESRRPVEQRVEADLDTGSDGTTEVLARRRDRVECRARAEVDHDRRAGEEVEGTDGIGDAIGTDLAGVVVEDRHAGLDAGAEHHRLDVEVAVDHAADRRGHPRHTRRHGDARDVGPVEIDLIEDRLEHDRVLVGGAVVHGGETPVVDQAGAGGIGGRTVFVQPEHDVGVTDVDREQHGALRRRCRGRCRARARSW